MTELVQVQIQSGEFSVKPAADVSSLIERFISYIDRTEKTAATYLCNLRQWAAWLRYQRINNPERGDVLAYRSWLQAEHDAIQLDTDGSGNGWKYRVDGNGVRIRLTCKPATAAIYIKSVKQFYHWTALEGLYPDIAADVRTPKVNRSEAAKDRLQKDEVIKLETSIKQQAIINTTAAAENRKDTAGRIERATVQGKRLYAMYMLAVTCGLRTIEIHRANVGDLIRRDGHSWLAVYGKGHNSADTLQCLPEAVDNAIQDYLNSRTDSYTKSSPLFVATGNRSGGQRIATTTISTMLKKAMQQAGYDSSSLTAHSLRHTATSAAYNATGSLYAAQQYARHVNPATTEIYIHEDNALQERATTAESVYNYYHDTNTVEPETTLQNVSTEQLLAELARRTRERA